MTKPKPKPKLEEFASLFEAELLREAVALRHEVEQLKKQLQTLTTCHGMTTAMLAKSMLREAEAIERANRLAVLDKLADNFKDKFEP